MTETMKQTGYPSIDKPWLKYYGITEIGLPSPKQSMYDYLYQCNRNNLTSNAIDFYGNVITFQKLFEMIDHVAIALQKNGINKGDIVSVCSLTTPETICLIYAINKIGAISNMIGLTSPVQDIHEQLASTRSKIVFSIEMAYESIVQAANETTVEKIIIIPIEYSMPYALKVLIKMKQKSPNIVANTINWKSFIKNAERFDYHEVTTDCTETAIIVYTGGTTGIPKGVMLTSYSMNSYHYNFSITNANSWTNYTRGESYLSCIPLFLAIGLSSCLHGPLCQGMICVLSPDPGPEAVAKIILRRKPEHIVCAPIHYNLLVERLNKRINLSYIKSAMYGGESIDQAWEKRINDILSEHKMNCPVLNGYGMTETAAAIMITTKNMPSNLLPLFGVDLKVINENMTECKYGEEGELCFSSNTIMKGYYHNDSESNKAFFEENNIKWLRSNDLAIISEDGLVQIIGRIKRIYWKKGLHETVNRVYPLRIEEAIEKDERVINSSVVGIKNSITGYRTIAFIIAYKNADIETLESDLKKICQDNLPESHLPDEYRFLDSFPLTRAGKVDYRKLEKLAEEQING